MIYAKCLSNSIFAYMKYSRHSGYRFCYSVYAYYVPGVTVLFQPPGDASVDNRKLLKSSSESSDSEQSLIADKTEFGSCLFQPGDLEVYYLYCGDKPYYMVVAKVE